MLLRYDPFRELERLTSTLFDQATSASRSMPMDAYRQGDDLYVHLDLPGVDPSSIDLTVEHNALSVTARREFDRTAADSLIASERPQGIFHRQVFLGEGMDTEHLEADYANGVLTIRVPVSEAARPRRVPITTGEDTSAAIEAESTEEPATSVA